MMDGTLGIFPGFDFLFTLTEIDEYTA